jgi:uncharacterized protein YndB with AHSA1/START domain
MVQKEKYCIEINLNASPKLIYPRLSTPSGLSEWFADDVNAKGDEFSFIWKSSVQNARVIASKEPKFIRFRWIEDEENKDDYYFEFKIEVQEMSGNTALIVTDFAEPSDLEDAKSLWESQVGDLKRLLGL